jgi:hypothetical protein
MGETMVQQLENDRIEENKANNSYYSYYSLTIARIKENETNDQKNELKKQIEI